MQEGCNWVVDLCCGSGSGCVAAMRMGYSAFGVDRSVVQVNGARRRLHNFITREAEEISLRPSMEEEVEKRASQTAKDVQYAELNEVDII